MRTLWLIVSLLLTGCDSVDGNGVRGEPIFSSPIVLDRLIGAGDVQGTLRVGTRWQRYPIALCIKNGLPDLVCPQAFSDFPATVTFSLFTLQGDIRGFTTEAYVYPGHDEGQFVTGELFLLDDRNDDGKANLVNNQAVASVDRILATRKVTNTGTTRTTDYLLFSPQETLGQLSNAGGFTILHVVQQCAQTPCNTTAADLNGTWDVEVADDVEVTSRNFLCFEGSEHATVEDVAQWKTDGVLSACVNGANSSKIITRTDRFCTQNWQVTLTGSDIDTFCTQ